MKNNVVKEIDHAIKDIWMHEIRFEYDHYYLLKEDTLKNALYHHLRNRLDPLLTKNHLRIYTEFTDGPLQGSGRRADIAIVEIDEACDVKYLKHFVKEVVCIIEIKYKSDYTSGANHIRSDFSKLEYYIKKLKINCQYYMISLFEADDEQIPWLEETEIQRWAEGKVTELNASYNKNGEMKFYKCSHNQR